jgi:hypothetical protein
MADGMNAGAKVGKAQGWYIDPFGVHQHRWISQDRPSDLVRDDGVESKDPPPDAAPTLPYVKVVADPRSMSNRDTFRADGNKGANSPDLGDYGVAAMDANVVFDSGLVGAPTAEGALKGGRFGGRKKPAMIPTPQPPPPRWIPFGIVLAALVGALLIGVGSTAHAPPDQVRGDVVSGTTVLSPTGSSEGWRYEVEYTVPGRGQFRTEFGAKGSSDQPGPGVGSDVTVSYDPKDPARGHLVPNGVWADISGGTGTEGEFAVFLGVMVLVFALVWAVRWRRRKAQSQPATGHDEPA